LSTNRRNTDLAVIDTLLVVRGAATDPMRIDPASNATPDWSTAFTNWFELRDMFADDLTEPDHRELRLLFKGLALLAQSRPR
jgi:hypothetical protein